MNKLLILALMLIIPTTTSFAEEPVDLTTVYGPLLTGASLDARQAFERETGIHWSNSKFLERQAFLEQWEIQEDQRNIQEVKDAKEQKLIAKEEARVAKEEARVIKLKKSEELKKIKEEKRLEALEKRRLKEKIESTKKTIKKLRSFQKQSQK